jgi:hypothetical protein
LQFEASIAIESDVKGQYFLQTYWQVPTFYEMLEKTIAYLASTIEPPAIQ